MSNENDEQNRAEVDRVEAALELHAATPVPQPSQFTVWCNECSCAWPCDTARVLRGGNMPDHSQPAGEQHTGTLNLTGEGNAPASPISDAAAEAAAKAMHAYDKDDPWDDEGCNDSGAPGFEFPSCKQWTTGMARAALEAAVPAIRQQVAEEIAAAIGQAGNERSPERHHAHEEKSDHGSTRYASYLDAASVARKIGAKA